MNIIFFYIKDIKKIDFLLINTFINFILIINHLIMYTK